MKAHVTFALGMLLSMSIVASAGEPVKPYATVPLPRWDAITPTRDVNDFTLHIHVLQPGELRKICRPMGVYEGLAACYEWNEQTKECTLHTFAPADTDDRWAFEAIGHALWHCKAGDFHKD